MHCSSEEGFSVTVAGKVDALGEKEEGEGVAKDHAAGSTKLSQGRGRV